MSKLYRARSLLYRRQILQENIRWKALDEIYKIYMLLHRSNLNILPVVEISDLVVPVVKTVSFSLGIRIIQC